MNILFITIFFVDLWFLRYREFPYSVTSPYTSIYSSYICFIFSGYFIIVRRTVYDVRRTMYVEYMPYSIL